MNINYLIDGFMRYDYKPLRLEKGDLVDLVGDSQTEPRVTPAVHPSDVEKVFIKVGNDAREISRQYVVLPGDSDY